MDFWYGHKHRDPPTHPEPEADLQLELRSQDEPLRLRLVAALVGPLELAELVPVEEAPRVPLVIEVVVHMNTAAALVVEFVAADKEDALVELQDAWSE